MPMPIRLTQQMRIAPFASAAAIILATALFVLSSPADAAPPANLVQAELLADVATIKPGQPFTLGVRFNIKPAWHIYWKNPGDSGLPTRITWKLPPGFTAGELQLPIPKRIELPGEIVNYGYEDEVMLLTQIAPPKDLPAGDVNLAADASWLVCEKVCLPGKASVNRSLPVANQAKPANQELFEQWSKRLPVAAERLSGVGIDAKPLDITTGSGTTEILATLQMTDIPIPDAVPGLEITIGIPETKPSGTRFPITAHVMGGQKITANQLEVLVGVYKVTIPIVGAAHPSTAPSAK